MKQITINLAKVVGSPYLVDEEDGDLVFEKIVAALDGDQYIELSFEGAETIVTAFLNRAIGKLYSRFSEDTLRSHLKVSHIAEDDARRFVRAVTVAKEFYKDPEAFIAARAEAIAECL